MTTHIVPPGTMEGKPSPTSPYTAHTYFDLLHAIDEIPDAYMAARISNSIAWRWDVEIVRCVRAVFTEIREALIGDGSVETRADATAMLSEMEFAEENFGQIGSAAAGPISQFHQLLALRPKAVALAVEKGDCGELYRGQYMTYEDPGIEARLTEQRTASVSAAEKANIKLEARKLAQHKLKQGKTVNPNYEARYIEETEAAALVRAEQLAELTKQQIPALEVIYTLMLKNRPEEGHEIENFHELDMPVQMSLVSAAADAAKRAKDDARSDRSQAVNFTSILDAYLDFDDLMAAVSNSPKFKAARQEAQAMAAMKTELPPKPMTSLPTVETHGEATV